jgi:hypothetical protein
MHLLRGGVSLWGVWVLCSHWGSRATPRSGGLGGKAPLKVESLLAQKTDDFISGQST